MGFQTDDSSCFPSRCMSWSLEGRQGWGGNVRNSKSGLKSSDEAFSLYSFVEAEQGRS